MTAAADQPGGRPPFADASPAEVRAALTPEDAESFEQDWRRLMGQAVENFDLSEVGAALEAWRRTAWVTSDLGHDGYRAMLADAQDRLRTGERAPGAVSWDELKVELGRR